MNTQLSNKFLNLLFKNRIPHVFNQIYKFVYRNAVVRSDFCWQYHQKLTKIRKATNESCANPFQIYWVDPSLIQYMTGEIIDRNENTPNKNLQYVQSEVKGINKYGRVQKGEWDTSRDKFTQLSLYKGIKQRYIDEIPWEETEFFEKHLAYIRSDGSSYGCQCKEKLLKKCNKYEKLLLEIKNKGYKTQRQLNSINFVNEVSVNISRNGHMMFDPSGGRHRLSIAKVLDLDKIPVLIKIRHSEWERKREAIKSKIIYDKYDGEYIGHPDIKNIQP